MLREKRMSLLLEMLVNIKPTYLVKVENETDCSYLQFLRYILKKANQYSYSERYIPESFLFRGGRIPPSHYEEDIEEDVIFLGCAVAKYYGHNWTEKKDDVDFFEMNIGDLQQDLLTSIAEFIELEEGKKEGEDIKKAIEKDLKNGHVLAYTRMLKDLVLTDISYTRITRTLQAGSPSLRGIDIDLESNKNEITRTLFNKGMWTYRHETTESELNRDIDFLINKYEKKEKEQKKEEKKEESSSDKPVRFMRTPKLDDNPKDVRRHKKKRFNRTLFSIGVSLGYVAYTKIKGGINNG